MLDEIYLRLLLEVVSQEPKRDRLLTWESMKEEGRTDRKPNEQFAQVVKSVYAQDINSTLGLRFGQCLLPSQLCDYSRIFITSKNLKEGFEVGQKYFYLLGTCYYPLVMVNDGLVSISLMFPFKKKVSSLQRRFCCETAFSYLVNAIRATVDRDFVPDSVFFDFARPDYVDGYQQMFGEQLNFSAPLNVFQFDAALLEPTLKSHNETLHQMYLSKYLDGMQFMPSNPIDFEYKAISYLLLNHPNSFNSESLASMLNISVRGLQKKLSKSNQSFSGIANLCRKELAKIYLLQDKQCILYAAEQLGFKSVSGFRRFFKTEFNASPIDYIAEKQMERVELD